MIEFGMEKTPSWITGRHSGLLGSFPTISTRFSFADALGSIRVRWGISRMGYRITPGLYAAGAPDADSDVLVTANYKLSFDSLRRNLDGINAWVLVLDTKGVNVWCAAGKGTFGTEELIKRVIASNLSLLVRHRTLILPQLGAPGIAAHMVTKATGFKVVYGPIRAADLPRFLENGCKADLGMRTVTFNLGERCAVLPVELIQSWKLAVPTLFFYLLSLYPWMDIVSWATVLWFLPYGAAILMGSVVVPIMLPWIPGRSFAFKGWLACFVVVLLFSLLNRRHGVENIVYLLILPAISSFLALNFTGATPYTSLSGVRKEMKYALPLIIITAIIGIVIQIFNVWRA